METPAEELVRKKLTRTDIINMLIFKHDYKSYLEIGVRKGANFNNIFCPNKTGVDPDLSFYMNQNNETPRGILIERTSDIFFKTNTNLFDIIFIDGLHEYNQVLKDIRHAMFYLKDGGSVVVHDTNPLEEIHQRVPRESKVWNGDVWKAIAHLRIKQPISLYTVDVDYGVTVINKSASPMPVYHLTPRDFDEFQEHKKNILNLISEEDFYGIF